jgi:hypothetical protein
MLIKKIALSIVLAGSAGVACAAPANPPVVTGLESFFAFLGFQQKPAYNPGVSDTQGAPAAAPEMDPASAISGLTLLVGGIAVMVASRRRMSAAA